MQGKAKRQTKNAALFAGVLPSQPTEKSPYLGLQKQYFAAGTQDYVWQNAQYASNYFQAKVQGCIPGDFETVRGAYIRTMDIVEQSTGSNAPNDWQLVYFQDPSIQGLYTGAKLWYGGNTWIATSPMNMASATGNSVIRRCNAIWNYMDYYGNIKTEPFVWAKGPAQATANEYLDYMVVPNSYQKCVMQLNDATRQIAYNRRMVLGSSVYEVRGIVDFVCDFTDTEDQQGNVTQRKTSGDCHILFFDLVYQQPLVIDDMEKELAGGKAFHWDILVSGLQLMVKGSTQKLGVRSVRNGEAPDESQYPVSYLYESSDENVLTVDENGNVTAIGEGSAVVTVSLAQNPDITALYTVEVTENAAETQFLILPPLPESMRALDEYQGQVTVLENGVGINVPMTLTASGAETWAYSASLTSDGALSINCFAGSTKPLELKIQAADKAYEATIQLKGL